MKRMFQVRAAVLVLAVALCVALPAHAQSHRGPVFEFQIATPSMSAALNALADQADLQIAFKPESVANVVAPGVIGRMTADDALDLLLKGTPLEYVRDSSLVIVRPRGSGARPPLVMKDARKTSWNFAGGGDTFRVAMLTPEDPGVAPAKSSEEPQESHTASQSRVVRKGEPVVELGTTVVTGSHIRGVAPDSSPLTIYDRQDIERSGAATVDQFVRQIPQNFAGVDADTFIGPSTVSDNTARGTGINLRGLGQGSTLILLNGHRLSPAGEDGDFIDVSMIPLSAVERVEVLTDGASAIYGADAVAGVVNFVLRNSYDGLETSARYGDTTAGGGRELTVSQLLGRAWNRGTGLLVYEHSDQYGVFTADRDFIPLQPFPFQLIPEQHRESAVGTGRLDLTEALDVQLDGFYTKRKFAQDVQFFNFPRFFDGRTSQYGGGLTLGLDFADSWRVTLVGNFALQRQEERAALPDFNINVRDAKSDSEIQSVELKADGGLFAAPGGMARGSIGAALRREGFTDEGFFSAGIGLNRKVSSAFGEIFLPLIGEQNSHTAARRLEVSIAARYDDYDDMGASTEPKLGVLWAPMSWLNLRGTYATSFRAPPLSSLSDGAHNYFFSALPDPNAPDGITNTLSFSAAGNPELGPENSTSFTAGFDLRPASLPGFLFSATYFDVDYTDRVAGPPVAGSSRLIFSQLDTLAPFIDFTPDLAAIQEDIDNGASFVDLTNIGLANAEALFDRRLFNIASTKGSGFEVSLQWDFDTAIGRMGVFLSGDHLLELAFRPTDSTSTVELMNIVFTPMDTRARGGVSWGRGVFDSSLIVNYSDSYVDNLVVPAGRVGSWTTADMQFGYRADEGTPPAFLRGVTATLTVQNVLDEDPPHLAAAPGMLFLDFGFDITNASARGRTVAFQLTKQW